jgi:hypothetical protein
LVRVPARGFARRATGYFVINSFDSSTTQQHLNETATVQNLYDHNRDGSVTPTDVAVASGNVNSKLIQLLAP